MLPISIRSENSLDERPLMFTTPSPSLEVVTDIKDEMRRTKRTDQHWSRLGSTLSHLLEFNLQDLSTSTTRTSSTFRSLLAETTVKEAELEVDTKTTSLTMWRSTLLISSLNLLLEAPLEDSDSCKAFSPRLPTQEGQVPLPSTSPQRCRELLVPDEISTDPTLDRDRLTRSTTNLMLLKRAFKDITKMFGICNSFFFSLFFAFWASSRWTGIWVPGRLSLTWWGSWSSLESLETQSMAFVVWVLIFHLLLKGCVDLFSYYEWLSWNIVVSWASSLSSSHCPQSHLRGS